MLTFDPGPHIYRWHGAVVPSVTQVIGHLTDYSKIPADKLEIARQKGVAVHKMVELDANGDLDLATLPDWMRGHHDALCRFKEETGFECWFSEEMGYHEKFGYAGTPDIGGLLTKLKKMRGPALIDIKRSFYAGPAIGLQLAAYERMRNDKVERSLRTVHRFALRLDGDGKYRLEEFDDGNDFTVFLGCLAQHKWKDKYGRT